MELAEQIVLVNRGRIEQVGTPDELYDQPANPFVMGFVGAVTRIGEQMVRPHDIELSNTPTEASVQAMVERVVRLGFSCRVEVQLGDGERATVQTTRAQVDQLDLNQGDIVFVRALRGQRFEPAVDAEPQPAGVAG